MVKCAISLPVPLSASFRIIKLRKWFPADDPLAVPVARLCILREDFLLEMRGVYEERYNPVG
jgi:hypothetical protein